MSGFGLDQSQRPSLGVDVACRLLRFTVHGMPSAEAGQALELWRTHLLHQRADEGRSAVIVSVLHSSLAHIGWRVLFGPPSAVLPGMATIVVGVAAGILAALGSESAIGNGFVSAVLLVLGAVLVRHPRRQPRRTLAIATALPVPVLAASSYSIASDLGTASDWFLVAGSGTVAVGCLLVSLGATSLAVVHFGAARQWGFIAVAVGAGSIAVAELDWLLRWWGSDLMIPKSLGAAGTLAVAFTAWRIGEVPQDPEETFAFAKLESGDLF